MLSRVDCEIFEGGFGPRQMEVEIRAGQAGSIWSGDELVAYYIAREDRDVTDLIRLAVIDKFRRLGAGKFILVMALQQSKTPRVILNVKKTNREALGLYHQESFQICGELLDSWVMSRTTSL